MLNELSRSEQKELEETWKAYQSGEGIESDVRFARLALAYNLYHQLAVLFGVPIAGITMTSDVLRRASESRLRSKRHDE